MKQTVLILCTGNSCRSQMAEELVNHYLGRHLRAISAGTHPAAHVAEGAIEALQMGGIPTDGLRSKGTDAIINEPIDLVVTVCDNAKESCPVFPRAIPAIHVPFHDPHGELLSGFIRVRDDITSRLLPILRKHFGLLQNQPKRAQLALVVAMAQNRTIGINNTLPWRIPEDLKHFKALTMGHHMIMGRKTFDSIGKPLPGRTTVVVTRDRNLQIEGCVMAHSLDEALAACAGDEKIFVVGGAELYQQALPLVDTLYITEIRQDVEGDAHFPEFNGDAWQEVSRDIRHQETPQPLEYHFVTYRRK